MKNRINNEESINFINGSKHIGGVLIDHNNGAINGFCFGISIYSFFEYGEPGIHDIQEGFYVINGSGIALVGDDEFEIEKGMGIIVPQKTLHSFKRDLNSEPLKLLWIHSGL